MNLIAWFSKLIQKPSFDLLHAMELNKMESGKNVNDGDQEESSQNAEKTEIVDDKEVFKKIFISKSKSKDGVVVVISNSHIKTFYICNYNK